MKWNKCFYCDGIASWQNDFSLDDVGYFREDDNEDVDDLLADKANSTDIIDAYTKTEVDGLLTAKVDTANIVTALSSSSTDAQIPSAKTVFDAIESVSGGVPVDVYSKTDVDDLLANKADSTEIDDLKSTVVNGKTSVANAINDKLGTTLSNQTSFADMAYYINSMPMITLTDVTYQGGSRPKDIQITDCRVLVGSCNDSKDFLITCSGGPTSARAKIVRVNWESSESYDNNDTVYAGYITFDLSSKISVKDQRVFAIIFSQPVTFTITGNNTYSSVVKIL